MARKTPKNDSSRRSHGSSDRRPVDQILPPSIVAELREMAASERPITSAVASELEARHDLHARYGVTPRRLLNWLRRWRPQEPVAVSPVPQDGASESAPSNQRLREFRQRQASIASILESCFGDAASCKPELWERKHRIGSESIGSPSRDRSIGVRMIHMNRFSTIRSSSSA